jgi:hypothetical protein
VSALEIADVARHGDQALVIQVDVVGRDSRSAAGGNPLEVETYASIANDTIVQKATPLFFSSSVLTDELNRGRGLLGLPPLGHHGHFDDFIRC